MTPPQIVSKADWLAARTAFLAEEKAFTRRRDALNAARRALPCYRIDKVYHFDGPGGRRSLADLFGDRSQLVVYHFMFGPDWEAGCKSCSFWADHFDGMVAHLARRDVRLVAVSKAPLARLLAYRQRMGWRFDWYSAYDSDFNEDFHVTFTPEQRAAGTVSYNYRTQPFPSSEAPGVSVFLRNADAQVFHTYSCYARGLDMLNATYHMLDLVPKGRDEDGLPYPQDWVRRRDEYDDDGL